MKVDILFTACNRAEYTEESLRWLVINTNWDLVNKAIFWDDAGTFDTALVPHKFACIAGTKFGSPVAVMNAALHGSYTGRHTIGRLLDAPWFAKIDNDTVVPPGWLEACISVAETDQVDLIGIECREGYTRYPPMIQGYANIPATDGLCGSVFSPDNEPWPIIHYRYTDHVGGIGLFCRAAFDNNGLMTPLRTYYGFTEWQWANPHVRKVWIDPPLPVVLLDHVPVEPWMGLGEGYVKKGWQRESWGYYQDVNVYKWWLEAISVKGT